MRICLIFLLLLSSLASFAKEITIINSVNQRRNPNFLDPSNIVGQFKAGTSLKVLSEKKLLSGVIAYQVKSKNGEPVWVYGSSRFVSLGPSSTSEAGLSSECGQCEASAEPRSLRLLKRVVAQQEEQSQEVGRVMSADRTQAKPAATTLDVSNLTALSEDAKVLLTSLLNRGFSCKQDEKYISQHGLACRGTVSGYPKPVRIFIPPSFQRTDGNVLQMHFHGLTDSGKNFQINENNQSGYGDFGARLLQAQVKKSIVVVPESDNNSATYLNEFGRQNGRKFLQFISSLEDLTSLSFSKTALSGHSNGYLPINTIMGFPDVARKVQSVALFDGAYNTTTNITRWLNQDSSRKAWISWMEKGDVVATSKAFVDRVQNKIQIHTRVTNQSKSAFTTDLHFRNIEDGGFSDFLKASE